MNENMYKTETETEPKYNFMTQDEMELRLNQGEDTLDLSIEKWDRIYDALRLNERNSLTNAIDFSNSKTCALCKKYYFEDKYIDDINLCDSCPYYIFYKVPCDNMRTGIIGHWNIWRRDLSQNAAKEMRDALIEIKHNPHKIIGVE
jgi:hypothetical protein